MKIANVSASQVTTYEACPRAWHFAWVRGFKTPPSIAMQRGTLIHAGIEHVLRTGQYHDDEWAPYVKSMMEHIQLGLPDKMLIEHPIELPTAPGLPPWKGFIDLLDDTRYRSKLLRVTDHKTTSDFRYAKTPAELAVNTQLNSYARWVFVSGHVEDTIEVGHLYIKTESKTPKAPKALPVYVEVTRDHVAKVWEQNLAVVEEMVHDAEIENTELLAPKGTTNGQCQKYGGCPHRARCGIDAPAPRKGNGEGKMSDFLKRLAAAKGNDKANGNGAGVLPPDAPERTTPVPAVVVAATPAPEAVAAPIEASAVPAKRGRPKKDAASAPNLVKSFALYIDCMPTKDLNAELEPTLFEDWISPLLMTLNEQAMKASNLPDYRLLPFSQEKAVFSAAVNEALTRSMPSAMVIQSSSPCAKDALGVLIPHASQVIRGLRG